MKFRMLYVVLMSVAIAGCSSDEPEIAMGESGDAVVTLNTAGQLDKVLEPRANEITKLTVRGPINAEDFNAMWSASFNGQLSVIDLSGAVIDGNEVPACAFYHPDVQGDLDTNPNKSSKYLASIKLEQIILPEGIYQIGAYAFTNVWRLKEVTIPSTVESIGAYAFADCGLITVSLSGRIKEIEAYSFFRCTNLWELYLPLMLESLDKESLNVRFMLQKIYSAAKNPPVCRGAADGDTPFGRYDGQLSNSSISTYVPVYVPAGSAELYRNAPGWDYFKNFIELDPFPTEAVAKMR